MEKIDLAPMAKLVSALQGLVAATEKECAGLSAENQELRELVRVQEQRIFELERVNQEWMRLFPSAAERVNRIWETSSSGLAVGMFEAGQKIERSTRARKSAQSKNAEPRAWVLSEWQNRTDKGQSKASFAKQYAPLVKKRFPKDSAAVNPETIARDWLPKDKKASPK